MVLDGFYDYIFWGSGLMLFLFKVWYFRVQGLSRVLGQNDKVLDLGVTVYSYRVSNCSGAGCKSLKVRISGCRALEDVPHAQPVVVDFNNDSLNDILVVDGTWEGSELLYFERLPNGSLEERWELQIVGKFGMGRPT